MTLSAKVELKYSMCEIKRGPCNLQWLEHMQLPKLVDRYLVGKKQQDTSANSYIGQGSQIRESRSRGLI